jgi:hypothetical protein
MFISSEFILQNHSGMTTASLAHRPSRRDIMQDKDGFLFFQDKLCFVAQTTKN